MDTDSEYLSKESENRTTKEINGWFDILLKTDDEHQDCIDNYFSDSKRLSPILDYRETRLASQRVSFEDFERSYLINKQHALEKLFLHPVRQHEISFLENEMKEQNTTLHTLYDMHIANPSHRLMRLLL